MPKDTGVPTPGIEGPNIVTGNINGPLPDMVNSPYHYTHGGKECIDWIESLKLGYSDGNAFKYLYRHNYKGKPIEDLKKAVWYMTRYSKRLESYGFIRREWFKLRSVNIQNKIWDLSESLKLSGWAYDALRLFIKSKSIMDVGYLYMAIDSLECEIERLER